MSAARLGVLLGLVVAAAVLFVRAHRVERPTHLALLSESEGSLDEICMHYVPELEPVIEKPYGDFLQSLDARTRVVFVVRKGTSSKLEAFLDRLHVHVKMRIVEVEVPLGIWSKDRALVVASNEEERRTTLLIPPRPRPGETSRPQDWDIVPSLAARAPNDFVTRQIPVAFEAGDFAVAGHRVVFDVNLFARNHTRGVRSPADLRERVRAMFGGDAVMLGDQVGDVPMHHMSMYMVLLDDHTALVGDPRAGEALVGSQYEPGEVSPETHVPLRAAFSKDVIARFDRAASDLSLAGFRVVRIPTVPFDDKTYFAYTNGVFETRENRRIARIPSFDVPELDRAARAVYESLGWSVIPIASRTTYAQHGTIGCLVNVLQRSM